MQSLLSNLALAAIVTLPAVGRADEERTWEFELSAPQWLATEHGHVPFGGTRTRVDIGFDELFDLIKNGDLIGGAGHFEVHNRAGHFTLFADAVGVVTDTVEANPALANGVTEIDTSLVFVEFGGGYRFGPWTVGRGARHFWAEPMVGGRYTKIEIDVEVRSNGMHVADSASDTGWVDPFVGGRWMLDLFPWLALTFRADIGGFDTGSDLAWSIVSTLVYRLPFTVFSTRPFLVTGYRVIDLEFEAESGSRDTRVDLNFRGPLAGMGATF
jgi:hypothetical protein